MARLELLRHGATVGSGRYQGRTDVALSAPGRAQMPAAVAGRQYARILSSPLARCREFAQTHAREQGLPLQIDARLVELHFGDWEDRCVADLDACEGAALAAFWRDPQAHPPPRGETLAQLQARVLAAIGELAAAADPEQRVLVVTHGGPIRVLLAACDGIAAAGLLAIEVAHASLIGITALGDAGALQLARTPPGACR